MGHKTYNNSQLASTKPSSNQSTAIYQFYHMI